MFYISDLAGIHMSSLQKQIKNQISVDHYFTIATSVPGQDKIMFIL